MAPKREEEQQPSNSGSGYNYEITSVNRVSSPTNLTARSRPAPQPDYARYSAIAGMVKGMMSPGPTPTADRLERDIQNERNRIMRAQRMGLLGVTNKAFTWQDKATDVYMDRALSGMYNPETGEITEALTDEQRAFYGSGGEEGSYADTILPDAATEGRPAAGRPWLGDYVQSPLEDDRSKAMWLALEAPGAFKAIVDAGGNPNDIATAKNVFMARSAADAAGKYAMQGMTSAAEQVVAALPMEQRLMAIAFLDAQDEKQKTDAVKARAEVEAQSWDNKSPQEKARTNAPRGVPGASTGTNFDAAFEEPEDLNPIGALVNTLLIGVETATRGATLAQMAKTNLLTGELGTDQYTRYGAEPMTAENSSVADRLSALWESTAPGFISQASGRELVAKYGKKNFDTMYAYYMATQSEDETAMPRFFASIDEDPEAQALITSAMRGENVGGDKGNGAELFEQIAGADQGNYGNLVAKSLGLEPTELLFNITRDATNVSSWFVLDPLLIAGTATKAVRLAKFGLGAKLARHGGSVSRAINEDKSVALMYQRFGESLQRMADEPDAAKRAELLNIHNRQFTSREARFFNPVHTDVGMDKGLYTAEAWADFYKGMDDVERIVAGKPISVPREPWLKGKTARRNAGNRPQKRKEGVGTERAMGPADPQVAYEPTRVWNEQLAAQSGNRAYYVPHMTYARSVVQSIFRDTTFNIVPGANQAVRILEAELGAGWTTKPREEQVDVLAKALQNEEFAQKLGASLSDFQAIGEGGKRTWIARNIIDKVLGGPGSDGKWARRLGWARTEVDKDGNVRAAWTKGWARKRVWNRGASASESIGRIGEQYRRLLTVLPDARSGIVTDSAKDADKVYQMAVASGMGKDASDLLRLFWTEANEGQRQLALSGLVRSFLRAGGVNVVDPQAERELVGLMSGVREGEQYAASHIFRYGGVMRDIAKAANDEHERLVSEVRALDNPYYQPLSAAQAELDGLSRGGRLDLKGAWDREEAIGRIAAAADSEDVELVLVRELRRQEGKGVRTYSRGRGSGYGDGLDLDDADIAAVWQVGDEAASLFEAANIPGYTFVEVKGANGARAFRDAMSESTAANKFGSSVEVKSLEEYTNGGYRLFLTDNGAAGFAVRKSDGDWVSVFSTKGATDGAVDSMARLAIQVGAKKADAFDTVLPRLYKRHGFEEKGRDPWNEEYRPPGWDKATYSKYNDGEPDLVYFEVNKAYTPKATKEEIAAARQKRNDLKAAQRKWEKEQRPRVPSVEEIRKGMVEEARKPGGSLAQRMDPDLLESGVRGGLYPDQLADRMYIPNFQVLDRFMARTSLLNALLFNNRLGSSVTNLWVLGTLAGPKFQLRNGFEDMGLYALTGGKVAPVVRGRRMDQAVTEAVARDSKDLSAKQAAQQRASEALATAQAAAARGRATVEDVAAAERELADADAALDQALKLYGRHGKLGIFRTMAVDISERATYAADGRVRDGVISRIAQFLVPTTSSAERKAAALAGREEVVNVAAKALMRQKLARSGDRTLRAFGRRLSRAKSMDDLTDQDKLILSWETQLLRSEYGYQLKEEAAETSRHLSDSTLPTVGDQGSYTYLDGELYRAVYLDQEYATKIGLTGATLTDKQARAMLAHLQFMTARYSLNQRAMFWMPQYWEAINAAGGVRSSDMVNLVNTVIKEAKESKDWAYIRQRMRINSAEREFDVVKRMMDDMAATLTGRNGDWNQDLWSALRRVDDRDKKYFTIGEGDDQAVTVEDFITGRFDHPESVLVFKSEPVWVPENMGQEFGTKAWEMMGRSLARLTRNPLFYGNYLEARKALLPLEAKYARIFGDDQAAKMITNLAAERAYGLTMSYVDNPAVRTNLAWQVRNIARYYRAQEDFARRVIRVGKYEPMAYWKAVLAWQASQDFGFVHKDQYGQEYFIYPMSAPAMAALQNITGAIGLSSSKFASAPVAFGGKVQWLSPSLDPNSWMPTASSPWTAVTLQPLLRSMPVAKDFFKWVESQVFGDISAQQSLDTPFGGVGDSYIGSVYGAMPPVVKKLQALFTSAISEDAPGTFGYKMTMKTIAAMAANGQLPEPHEWADEKIRTEFLETMQARTVEMSLLSLVFGFFAPASPQYMEDTASVAARAAGYEALRPAFREMLESSLAKGKDWTDAYLSWTASNPMDGVFLQAQSDGSENGYVAATMRNVDYLKKNLDVWQDNPRGMALFMPDNRNSPTSNAAFQALKTYNAQRWKEVSDYSGDLVKAEGYWQWLDVEQGFQQATASISEYLDDGSKNPEWTKAEEIRSLGRSLVRNEYPGIDYLMNSGGWTQASEYRVVAGEIVEASSELAKRGNMAASLSLPLAEAYLSFKSDYYNVATGRVSGVDMDAAKQALHDQWDLAVSIWLEDVGDRLTEDQKRSLVVTFTKAIPDSGAWEPVEVQ